MLTLKYSLLLLLASWPLLASAQDIRDKVAAPASPFAINETIDPGSHIFGIPFGISEDQFIAQYGSLSCRRHG